MITKEDLESVSEYISQFVIAFFPGLLLLDGVYSKGVMSSSIITLYDFVLLLFWAFVISFPFHFTSVFIDTQSLLPMEKRKGRFASMIELPFAISLALIIYIAFKVFECYHFICHDVIGISIIHLRFILAFIVGMLLSWPLAKLYRQFFRLLSIEPRDH